MTATHSPSPAPKTVPVEAETTAAQRAEFHQAMMEITAAHRPRLVARERHDDPNARRD
jgi:hypothetical protein